MNKYPTIDNGRGIAVVKNILKSRANKTPLTDSITEGLQICLKCSNSKFRRENVLHLNGTAEVATIISRCRFECFQYR